MNSYLSFKPKRKRKAKKNPRRASWFVAALAAGIIGMAIMLGAFNSSAPRQIFSTLREALESVDGVNITSVSGDENSLEVVINFRAEHIDGGRRDIYRLTCALLQAPNADYRLKLIGTATLYHAGIPNNIPIIVAYIRRSEQLAQHCSGGSLDFDLESLAYFYSEYRKLRPILLTPMPYGR